MFITLIKRHLSVNRTYTWRIILIFIPIIALGSIQLKTEAKRAKPSKPSTKPKCASLGEKLVDVSMVKNVNLLMVSMRFRNQIIKIVHTNLRNVYLTIPKNIAHMEPDVNLLMILVKYMRSITNLIIKRNWLFQIIKLYIKKHHNLKD